jgi:hypothetical protein
MEEPMDEQDERASLGQMGQVSVGSTCAVDPATEDSLGGDIHAASVLGT